MIKFVVAAVFGLFLSIAPALAGIGADGNVCPDDAQNKAEVALIIGGQMLATLNAEETEVFAKAIEDGTGPKPDVIASMLLMQPAPMVGVQIAFFDANECYLGDGIFDTSLVEKGLAAVREAN